MTQAVAVRRHGDTFQARLFWLNAAKLLDPMSPLVRVGFESGPKGYDDIWIEYDPTRAPRGSNGLPVTREHIQCKWHVSPGSYGFLDLIDPEFINANSRSLLQRAHTAQRTYAREGDGARFRLLSNWQLDLADPLREMVSNVSGAIRVERLYGSKTDNSKSGAIRKAWREHLSIDESELRILAGTLAFGAAADTLTDLRDRLDILFANVGLGRIPVNQSAFIYDELVFQWMAQGRLEFDRMEFRSICDQEGLLGPSQGSPKVFGVKSFEHPIDHLEQRCIRVLDLVPSFDERYIRGDADWAASLYPSLQSFLLQAAKESRRLRLALDAHVTLAFAAGSVLNVKSGRDVELEQRTTDCKVWAANDQPSDPMWPTIQAKEFAIHEDRPEIAISVGLTHDIGSDVRHYVEANLSNVGRLLQFRPISLESARLVVCGRHASELVEAAVVAIRNARSRGAGTIHLFIAAPNAFTFFLGQRQRVLGRVRLYEFDFDGGRNRSYTPSLTLPVQSAGT